MCLNIHHASPCLHCHPHNYIRMVHSLIERCLILGMNRDQCVRALAVHAGIRPLVTLTVWRGLLEENKDFFQSYFHAISLNGPRPFVSGHSHKVARVGDEGNNGSVCSHEDNEVHSRK